MPEAEARIELLERTLHTIRAGIIRHADDGDTGRLLGMISQRLDFALGDTPTPAAGEDILSELAGGVGPAVQASVPYAAVDVTVDRPCRIRIELRPREGEDDGTGPLGIAAETLDAPGSA